MEFLIKRTDDEWFDLHKDKMKDVFLPDNASEGDYGHDGLGDYRAKLTNGEIRVSYEDPGLQVVFENFKGTTTEAETLVNAMLRKLEAVTGQKGEVTRLS